MSHFENRERVFRLAAWGKVTYWPTLKREPGNGMHLGTNVGRRE